MRAEVIAIGDELTTGQRLDTNSQWLSQQLTEMGVTVAFHTTVGDELDDNVTALRTAFGRVDVVVASGGLGPTADDLTREALAAATGTSLVRDEASLEHIRRLFESRGRPMPSRNEVQADFPQGARPIANPHGTAPGIEMEVSRDGAKPCLFFALPGVPAEMQEMWQASVAPTITQQRSEPRVARHRRIKCFGVGESKLESMLPDMIRRDRQPRVGITVSEGTITLRITASGADEAACMSAMEPTVATIRQLLGKLVFGEGDDELEDVVDRLLREQKKTVAVAEWATVGLVGQWLRRASGADGCFLTGTVIDDLQQVNSMTSDGLPHASETAVALAEAIRQSAGADIGLGIAAFPPEPHDGGSHLHVALALPETTRKLRFPCASHPSIKQSLAAKQALNALRLTLLPQVDERL